MLACIDVDYGRGNGAARAAIVAFASWDAAVPIEQHIVALANVAPYESGVFYKRELPCLLAALKMLSQRPEIVIVDGYVWLGPGKPGLGAHLFATDRQISTVVGVAKTAFAGSGAIAIVRGESKSPLWVDEVGVRVDAPKRIGEMDGSFRVPTMLRLVDRLARAEGPAAGRPTPRGST